MNRGKKFDKKKNKFTKNMYHLLPMREMDEVVSVLTFGANKYGEDDWKHFVKRNDNYKRYISASLRHVSAFMRNDDNDDETECHHLAHAICCLLFVLWNNNERRDDKNK